MNWGLLIIYIFSFVGLLLAAHLHGEEKGKWNFWATATATILELVCIWWALGWRFA